MALPSIADLKMWVGTLLTKDDWNYNFSQLVSWLADGTSVIVVNSIKSTNGIDLDGSQISNIGAATEGSQAVNLDQALTILNRTSYYYPFSVASGKVDNDGNSAYLQKDSDTQVTVLGGNVNPDLVCIQSDGTVESVTSNTVLTVPVTDGIYHIIKEKGEAISITTGSANKVTIGKAFPSSQNTGDYFLDNSVSPFKGYKYGISGWEETPFCYLGYVTVSSGTATVTKQAYNNNNYDCVLTETYINNGSWYRVYSNGWCEQGGVAYYNNTIPNSENKNVDIEFLKQFKDTNYTFTAMSNRSNIMMFENDASPYDYSGRSTSGTSLGFRNVNTNASSTGNHGAYWIAKGYLADGEY